MFIMFSFNMSKNVSTCRPANVLMRRLSCELVGIEPIQIIHPQLPVSLIQNSISINLYRCKDRSGEYRSRTDDLLLAKQAL